MLLPIGEFAVRTNLLSALLSALGAGCFFLVAHESLSGFAEALEPRSAAVLRHGGALAAALIGAFTFTNWQNSNETEVYAVATFTIAAMCWLALRLAPLPGHAGGRPRVLLLIVYLGGISIGNHLLALLAGPAVVVFMRRHSAKRPRRDPAERRARMGPGRGVAGVWALLIGTGLGSSGLIALGGCASPAAAAYAFPAGAGGFAPAHALRRRHRHHALSVPVSPVRPASADQ